MKSIPHKIWTPVTVCLLVLAGCASQGGALDADPGRTFQDDVAAAKQHDHPAMLDPSKATEQAPETYKVKLNTTKGDIVIQVNRDWSPNGADRFYNLVKIGYFKDVVFFRAIPNFMVQFGIHGDPAVNEKWKESNIQDDAGKQGVSNEPGYLTFAKTGRPNSRSVQFFINLGNNARLDSMGFTPIGKVVEGMDNFMKLNTEYGENKPADQGSFQSQGNPYIMKEYPNLDMIKSAEIVPSK
ncbi:MAG: peptidylprolyl isomerase [Mariniblastus sp.]|nr:peptidylprolyl isomerase [Mariniblastus sp.]